MIWPGFIYLETAFTLWMLVDAIRRGAQYYWLFIIFGFQPFGPWIYFFMVKVHDYDFRHLSALFYRPPSVEQLRYRAKENPCAENKIALAAALCHNNEHQEAAELFGQVLKSDPRDKEALYGLGLCQIKSKDFPAAVASLTQAIAVDKAYQDYAPWSDLAYALWQDGQKDEAIRQLENLMQVAPRMNHATILAQYLIQAERKAEARALLENALDDYAHAPGFVKRTYSKWAKTAKGMLKALT